MEDEKKPSVSEVSSTLRAMGKLFKHLKYANEAAVLVLDADKSVKASEREVESLKREKELLNKECDAIVVKTTEAEKDLAETIKKTAEISKDAVSDIKKIKACKEVEAEDLIKKAKQEASDIREHTEQSLKARDEAAGARIMAEKELKKIEAQVKSAKDSFLKAFG